MGIRALPNLPIICVLLACCISPGKLDAQPDNDLCQNAELIVLESGRILIRTTKLSGVGVFLLIIALGVLIFWWIKSNRARKTT